MNDRMNHQDSLKTEEGGVELTRKRASNISGTEEFKKGGVQGENGTKISKGEGVLRWGRKALENQNTAVGGVSGERL